VQGRQGIEGTGRSRVDAPKNIGVLLLHKSNTDETRTVEACR